MFSAERLFRDQHTADVVRRHACFAEAYVEAKMVVREMSYHDRTSMSVPFKPVHLYMHVICGFNTYFEPAYFTGWRRLRMIDVDADQDNPHNVLFSFNAAYLAKRDW